MTTPDRRKDNLYKTLLIVMCGFSGAGGGWGGSKISQAELQRMISAQGQTIQEVKAEMADLRRTKIDRDENQAADAAQDQRMTDVVTRLDAIQRDQAETLRLLVQIQRGR